MPNDSLQSDAASLLAVLLGIILAAGAAIGGLELLATLRGY